VNGYISVRGWLSRGTQVAATGLTAIIRSLLANSESTDFPFLREHLGVSSSDLSKQMTSLEQAGYVEINKTGRGRGATTTYKITRLGRRAYQRHRAALRMLLGS
jgi:DNA-binding MarR family transcriptional regulator